MRSARRRYGIALCGCAIWLLIPAGGWAQGRPVMSGREPGPKGAEPARVDPAADQDKKTTYPANAPADPARVSLNDGKLTISANNSDLAQILQELAQISGMTVKGIEKGPRMFGQYGPGDSRAVLSTLLTGSGFDFIMLGGSADGMPRELVLTRHDEKAASTESGKTANDSASQGSASRQQEPLGPGAVYPIPPQPPQDESERTRQNLQRLQRIHEEQQESQPQH